MNICLSLIGSAFIFLLAGAAFGAPADERMRRLATESGCTLCHAERQPQGDAVVPPAPAWTDIAKRYHGQRGAEQKLVQVVVHGAGPDKRHWEGKTRFIAMPPNPVEISEQDAHRLVRWILRRGP